ncbi:P-loop containing nucleoside triphosphate hydrolase [Phytophthora cactorum]|nr:P-loop containing nucleoside triphosphate hydrolase [Phytophthora cactorum]
MELGWENSYSEGYGLNQGYGDEATALTGENKPRILLMGLRRSGKSSIQRVVFHKMSPHETLFLEGTNSWTSNTSPTIRSCSSRSGTSPETTTSKVEDLVYGGQLVNEEMIFSNCGSIVFVIDAQDEPYAEALARLHDTVTRAHRYNPDILFEVFIHKVDGDLFLSDDHKIGTDNCQREIQQQIMDEINDGELDIHMSFYLTSIYDHSIFEAFSKVVQKLIPQLPTLENLLNILITSCNMEKSFLFDVVSKVYIATDSNPVDMQSYELCSDMIDVVIDVSCIYGMKDDGEGDGLAYDAKSSSVIKLNNGMVLYLREVNNYLALVCLLRAENFMKQGIIDYNIDCFKSAIGDVFKAPKVIE